MAVKRLLAIASVERTGSTLLCSILRATRVAGHPIEYLNVQTDNFDRLRRRLGAPQIRPHLLPLAAVRRATGRYPWRDIDSFTPASVREYLLAVGEAVGNRQKFSVSPLEPGLGHTIGNSLRRMLLSSIPGAAITSVKFDEALHEFTTIKGVVDRRTRQGHLFDRRSNGQSPSRRLRQFRFTMNADRTWWPDERGLQRLVEHQIDCRRRQHLRARDQRVSG